MTDAEAPSDIVGLGLREFDKIGIGTEPVAEAVAPKEICGLPYSEIEALKHLKSIQP